MSGLLLDTHVVVWIGNQEHVAPAIQRQIDDAYRRDAVYVSAVSAWEITLLATRGRIAVTPPTETWFDRFIDESGFIVLPLTPECAVEAALLPDIHRDPADRFLMATARLFDLTLVTRDKNMRKYFDAGYVNISVC